MIYKLCIISFFPCFSFFLGKNLIKFVSFSKQKQKKSSIFLMLVHLTLAFHPDLSVVALGFFMNCKLNIDFFPNQQKLSNIFCFV